MKSVVACFPVVLWIYVLYKLADEATNLRPRLPHAKLSDGSVTQDYNRLGTQVFKYIYHPLSGILIYKLTT